MKHSRLPIIATSGLIAITMLAFSPSTANAMYGCGNYRGGGYYVPFCRPAAVYCAPPVVYSYPAAYSFGFGFGPAYYAAPSYSAPYCGPAYYAGYGGYGGYGFSFGFNYGRARGWAYRPYYGGGRYWRR